MQKKRLFILTIVSIFAVALMAVSPVQAGVQNTFPPPPDLKNPTCADLNPGFYEIKFDPPVTGSQSLGGMTVNLTMLDLQSASWTSNMGIDAVIVKGGEGGANIKYYDPEATADPGPLYAPLNPSGFPANISHVSFCFDYEVSVTKTAVPHLTRTYTWTIDKSADKSTLLLSAGQVWKVNYGVTVDVDSYVDSDWGVTGEINIYNPSPFDSAYITGDSWDKITPGDIVPNVDCGGVYTIPPLGTLKCTYSADLPDGTTRTNTVKIITSGKVGGGTGSATIDFSSPSTVISKVDDCVDVSDTLYGGALGKVCVGDAPRTFNYSKYFSTLPGYDVLLECGENLIDNTASFVTDDNGFTGQDTWRVTVTVACEVGCTLTQGYWKTHSELGPAPYDPAWGNLGTLEEQTPFFLSGNTWYDVFWTAPAGNVYYNLAHQYMAAKLNILDGASTTPAVDASITVAETLFGTTTPAQTAKIKNPDRQVWVALASILDQYNNGYIGPGHCSE